MSVARNRSVITPRDLEWLEWMGRWRFVTGPMIAREFSARGQSAPPTSVDRRLRVFIERGLVGYERVLADTPRLLWLTRAGMRLAELDGPVVTPKFADIRHDLKVIDVAHWLSTTRVPSHTLVTEREIRRREGGLRPDESGTYSLRVTGWKRNRAYPDLVSVNPSGRAWGHEIELSRKNHDRLVHLMRAYYDAPAFAGAVYYVADHLRPYVEAAAKQVNEAATQDGANGHVINVEPLPSIGGQA